MRSDSIGLFWEDLPAARGHRTERPMPPIPDSDWRLPTVFPDWRDAPVLALDVETYDPELLDKGPGWSRGVGHLVGVSLCVPGQRPIYLPFQHQAEPGNNLDLEKMLPWLRHTLGNPHQPKVGANITYDVGWLRHSGVPVAGMLYDVQFAEALLNESGRVGLEDLGVKYTGAGKESPVLYQFLADWFGGKPNGEQRKHIYRAPAKLVGPYAESDASLPLEILEKQWPLLHREGLFELFELECKLIPLMIAMREAGVRVDVTKAEELRDRLEAEEALAQQKLDAICGMPVNMNAAESLRQAFDELGVRYPVTAKGNPSFTGAFLNGLDHPVGATLRELRKLNKLRTTFVEGYVLNSHVDGMVYGQFHQLRGDANGTRSGRLSSSTPNLQNIPSRDSELAPLVRGIFVPDYGHKQWRRYDYSQIEYRFLIHYAVGVSGRLARQRFNDNPDLDYHAFAQELIEKLTGLVISRKPVKTINFGLIYGMGKSKLIASLGLSQAEGSRLYESYFQAVPFAKDTMDACSEEAQRTGAIRTILNRRSQFALWEPADWQDRRPALPYDQARAVYGYDIQRAHTHKALNRRLQGSAADQMKKAMLDCWEAGVFDVTGVPRLTVHDELDFSDPGGCDEAFAEIRRIMETAIPLTIPVKADCEVGPDWGHVK